MIKDNKEKTATHLAWSVAATNITLQKKKLKYSNSDSLLYQQPPTWGDCWYNKEFECEINVIISLGYPHQQSHYTDFKWALRCVDSLATWLLVQQLAQGNNNGKIQATHYWPFTWRDYHHQWTDSPHKGTVIQKVFLSHDIIMVVENMINDNT